MTKLHDISDNYLQVLDSDLPADCLQDTLESLSGEFEDKALNIIKYTNHLDSDIAAVDAEIKRLQERKKSLTNKKDSFRDYIRVNMERCGLTKISSPIFNATLGKGIDSVVIDDINILPDEFVSIQTEIKPDKKAILSAIKSGKEIAGARIEQGKSRLLIK